MTTCLRAFARFEKGPASCAFLPAITLRWCKNRAPVPWPHSPSPPLRTARQRIQPCAAFDFPRASHSYSRRERDAWPQEEIQQLPSDVRPKAGETLDLILRAKVFLLQSEKGYRANTDSLVLAYYSWQSFCEYQQQRGSPVCADEQNPPVLMDIGAGNGLVSMLLGLAANRRQASLVLVEKQPQLACRARRNLELNGVPGYVLEHDVSNPLPHAFANASCVVAINPPFYVPNSRAPPKNEEKAVAHIESTANLGQFLACARNTLQRGPGNVVCMIHDMKQLDRIVLACGGVQLDVVEALEVMHSSTVSTGRVLLKLRHSLPSGRTGVKAQVKAGTLCLHPESCEDKRYFAKMEEFLSALPSPMWDIGRQDYLGTH